MGAKFLQWPHLSKDCQRLRSRKEHGFQYQGAKNSTRAGLLDSKTTLSKFEGMRFSTLEAAAAAAKKRGDSRTISAFVLATERASRGLRCVRTSRCSSEVQYHTG